MGAAVSLETIRTGTPDGANGLLIANISAQESGTTEIPAGVSLSDRIVASLAADRTVTAADSATDMSTSGFGSSGLTAINNRGSIVIWGRFEVTTDSATLVVIYYDSADNPLFVGPSYSLTPDPQRVSASGYYMTDPVQVESFGASKYKVYVSAKGDAVNDLTLYSQPV